MTIIFTEIASTSIGRFKWQKSQNTTSDVFSSKGEEVAVNLKQKSLGIPILSRAYKSALAG
jgi:hypothetical protein